MTLAARFPRLAKYIDVLPEGLASYPKCRSKGSLIRGALEGHDAEKLLPDLPKALAEYVGYPPPSGAWVSAVHNTALFYAVCDAYYPSEHAMKAWVRKRTRAMGTGLYRGLLRVTGPSLFFRVAEKTHGLLQQGTQMDNLRLEGKSMSARLVFPPHLFTHFMLLANSPTYEVLTELAGGKDARCKLVAYDATSATYEGTWR